MKEIRRLSVDEIRDFAHRVAREMKVRQGVAEPIPDFHRRYPGVLESCLNAPFQSFGGEDLYPGIARQGAVMFYLMIKNHPFANGNKRIAVVTLRYFFLKNNYGLELGENSAVYLLSKEVAESGREDMQMTIDDLAAKFEAALMPADRWLKDALSKKIGRAREKSDAARKK